MLWPWLSFEQHEMIRSTRIHVKHLLFNNKGPHPTCSFHITNYEKKLSFVGFFMPLSTLYFALHEVKSLQCTCLVSWVAHYSSLLIPMLALTKLKCKAFGIFFFNCLGWVVSVALLLEFFNCFSLGPQKKLGATTQTRHFSHGIFQ